MVNLLTWNIEGAKYDQLKAELAQNDIDVCCIQEAGPEPWKFQTCQFICDVPQGGQLFSIDMSGTGSSGDYYMWHYKWSDAGKITLALVWKESLFKPKPNKKHIDGLQYIERDDSDDRPALGVAIPSEGLYAYTLHAKAVSSKDARPLIRRISKAAPMNWVAAGDYNRDPDKLNLSDFPTPPTIYPPDGPTHISGKRLDYLVSNHSTLGCDEGQVQNGKSPDHLPVLYKL